MLCSFPIFRDERGYLLPMEFKTLPFTPVRAFTVTEVPAGVWRGGHAHHTTEQLLVCIRGTIEYALDTGRSEMSGLLLPGEQILVPKMVWDKQRFISEDTVLLVLCSTPYDQADYITDYHVFMKFAA